MNKITIGRSADNNIVIAGPYVSSYHAELLILDDGTMLFIDHSTNGTMVNGEFLRNSRCNVTRNDYIEFPGQFCLDWSQIPSPCVPAYGGAPARVAQAPQQQYAQQQYSQQQYAQQAAPYPAQSVEVSMGFGEALTKFWKNYFNYSDRARRKEYWFMVLWNMIFSIIPVIGWLVLLAASLGYLSLMVRRLHDIGKSGWFLLLGLIPLVGGIILLVFCCTDSEKGPNKWGNSPKYSIG